jgi:hypothetical protein
MIPPRKFRILEPGVYDRVNHLLETTILDDLIMLQKLDNLTKILNTRSNTSSSSSVAAKEKFVDVMTKVELHLLKKSRYNFTVRNIPEMAILSDTRLETRVTYSNIRDTVEQFGGGGQIFSMYMNHGVAFFEMSTHAAVVETHKTLNRMQLGKNIITTSEF